MDTISRIQVDELTPPRYGAEVVLRAAIGLRQPFDLSTLALAAWRASPRAFGLVGLEGQYPSDRRVNVTLCGRKGLVGTGLIERCPGVDRKPTYRVTALGREMLERLGG